MGGDKKPSHEFFASGHGKTVHRRGVPPRRALGRVLHERRGPRGALLGRHPRRRRLGDAVGRLHPCERGRRESSPRPARTSYGRAPRSMAHGTGARRGVGSRRRSASPGSRSARLAAAPALPSARDWLARDRLRGAGPRLPPRPDRRGGRALPRDQRLGGDGDRAGSENFFTAHHAARRAALARLSARGAATSRAFRAAASARATRSRSRPSPRRAPRETPASTSASMKCVVASTIAAGALRGVARLEYAGADEDAVGAELHAERGVGRRGDPTGGEGHDRQLAVGGDPRTSSSGAWSCFASA